MSEEIRNKELEELERLAKDFIIGYEPLTDKQKEILENIEAMESQLAISKRKVARIERVINALYQALARD